MNDAPACTHADALHDPVTPSTLDGCAECLKTGGRWLHLRLCLTCGEVGCCDSSPNRHASRHAGAAEHPLIQSFQPDEDWGWCYVDELALDVGPARHPDAVTS